VTNTGPTIIGQDLGVWPGTAITGFPPGLVLGTIHATDAVAQQAQIDTTTAYNDLAGQACDTNFIPPTDLGGMTLLPGVYCFGSSAALTGTVTLSGGSAAVWVFKIPSTLITAPAAKVALIGGAQSCHVFWQVGSSATVDTTTSFVGNILALASITLNTSASLDGRALAQNGAVTMDSNTVSFTACAGEVPPDATATNTPGEATRTAAAATGTAAAATGTAIAATQTVIVGPTLTAIVGSQTAAAATQPPGAGKGTSARALPGTGFQPGVHSVLSGQPADKAYGSYGDLWLEIPRLAVKMAIVGVPPTQSGWDVTWLSNQAGWLQGTAFPTWAGNSVLTGHVYDANGQAGPFVKLGSLQYGDRIIVHAWGQQYIYEVRSTGTVSPYSVSSVIKHETLPWVTLITCKEYDQKTQSYRYRTVVKAVQVTIQ
jgi:LPXTG-site transpeptidase (sortase) family protein